MKWQNKASQQIVVYQTVDDDTADIMQCDDRFDLPYAFFSMDTCLVDVYRVGKDTMLV